MTPDAQAEFDRAWADAELERLARHLAGQDVAVSIAGDASLPTLSVDDHGIALSFLADAGLEQIALVQLYCSVPGESSPRVAEFAAGVNAQVAIGAMVDDPGSGLGFRHVNAFRAEPMLSLEALTEWIELFVHQVQRLGPVLARVATGDLLPAQGLRELQG